MPVKRGSLEELNLYRLDGDYLKTCTNICTQTHTHTPPPAPCWIQGTNTEIQNRSQKRLN